MPLEVFFQVGADMGRNPRFGYQLDLFAEDLLERKGQVHEVIEAGPGELNNKIDVTRSFLLAARVRPEQADPLDVTFLKQLLIELEQMHDLLGGQFFITPGLHSLHG